MSRSATIWIIAIIFAVYAAYNMGMIAKTGSYWFLIWVFACLACSLGLILNKKWSQYFVYLVSTVTAGGWLYVTINISLAGWPYTGIQNTVIALVPGVLLFLSCVLVSIYVYKYFKSPIPKT